MAIPTDTFRWATVDGSQAVTPVEGKKDVGFVPDEEPSAQLFNAKWNNDYEWKEWLKAEKVRRVVMAPVDTTATHPTINAGNHSSPYIYYQFLNTDDANTDVYFPLPMEDGERIKKVTVSYQRSVSDSMKVQLIQQSARTTVNVVANFNTDTGSVGEFKKDSAALTHDVVTDSQYYIIVSPVTGATDFLYLWGLTITYDVP